MHKRIMHEQCVLGSLHFTDGLLADIAGASAVSPGPREVGMV
jgi:hypothetical protein